MYKIFLILVALFMSSCSNDSYMLDYDNTNPVKIEESVSGLKLNEIIPSKLDGKIAVRSIELDISDQLDVGVVYMIEDHLVTNLINNGYNVLERDPDALSNLQRESYSKYRELNKESKNMDTENQDVEEILDFVNNNLKSGKDRTNVVNVNVSGDLANSKDLEQDFTETNLSSANYILSYRVLECGVMYSELDDNKDGTSLVEEFVDIQRNARTRLHCRLTNTKTSEIISAGIVENEVFDIIKRDDLGDLEQMSYEYYHHTLPNQNIGKYGLTKDSGYAYINEDKPIQRFSGKRNQTTWWPLAALGVVFTLMISAN